jgi:hypothetical protein
LSLVKKNDGNNDEGAIAYITSDYNTGYQLGDIRFAGLANLLLNDRSVKANTLTQNGSITSAFVATDAELKEYSGWSASNYVSKAADTDFDFGTGDFSVMFWAKFTSNDAGQCMLDRSTSGTPRILIYNTGGNVLQFYIHDGSGGSSVNAGSFGDDNWHQVVCVKRGTSSISIFVDGVLKGETTSIISGTLSSATAPLHIGVNNAQNDPLNGSLSLVRISATAPTPSQIKDIYRAEAPLFRAGAKCLLYANTVKDLAYDNSTGLLSVGQNATSGNDGVVNFRGLEKVSSFQADDYSDWSGNTSHKLVAAGGVSAYARTSGTGGVIVDLPAIDVRGDINTADTKLPDDGKIRFTGVTASTATPTVIGHIPLALGDKITVKARVQGHIYQYGSLNGYYEEITATFQRPYDTGTVAVHTSFSNPTHSLSDTTLAGLDVELSANDTAKTCEVKVTGSASYRMQWNATVEVQRISEKQYER